MYKRQVHKFYTAKEALQCIESTALDLAVLDVMLPETDGFSILRKIREKHKYPVIMLTAKVETNDKITGPGRKRRPGPVILCRARQDVNFSRM